MNEVASSKAVSAIDVKAMTDAMAFLAEVRDWDEASEAYLQKVNPDGDYWYDEARTPEDLKERPGDYYLYDCARTDIALEAQVRLAVALTHIRALLGMAS